MASVAGVSFIVAHRFQLTKKMALAVGRRLTRMPDDEAWRALAAGDLEGAKFRAREMLAAAEAQSEVDWLPDDHRHRAHIILGYVHLRRGDVDAAEAELLLSSEVEATPVLGSFGPDLGLAWELLLAGRSDGVALFAQRFGRFWRGPSWHEDV